MTDEAKLRKEQAEPLLIWEMPGKEEHQFLLGTQTGVITDKPRSGEPLVFEVKKSDKQNAFPMGVTIGRTDNNDIVIDDNSVSRFHAYLQKDLRTHQWKLVDAESKNGTWLGSTRLLANHGEPVDDQSRVKVGDIELLFLEPDSFFEYLKRLVSP